MAPKTRVAIVFGGRSAEHEVSLQSAKNIIDALDRDKYEPVLIGIDREGRWYLNDASIPLLDAEDPRNIRLNASGSPVALVPSQGKGEMIGLASNTSACTVDVIFPVLHGPYGEDGTIQGLAKLANLPCVGAGILGSAVGMDKDVAKRLLRDAGVPVADHVIVRAVDWRRAGDVEETGGAGAGATQPNTGIPGSRDSILNNLVNRIGLPSFVKPANLGSSVGVTKAHDKKELEEALDLAFEFDTKVLIEESIQGREIECSVLGNDDPQASVPGEVVSNAEFYSYDAKYIDENGAALHVPARLDAPVQAQIQKTAVEAFQVLECTGMARVDMFLTDDNRIYVNEINTIPGFTRISMYPKLWEVSGIPYRQLVDRLIQLAIEDFNGRYRLRVTR